jgi:GT2 family glycosyltransferase
MNLSPKILISVLNWNNSDDTIRCIHSLMLHKNAQSYIIVVDNASIDHSSEKIKNAFPDIHIIQSATNAGYAGGHLLSVNYGLENNFDLLWVLNNDLVIEVDTLKELLSSFLKNPNRLYGSISVFENENRELEYDGGYDMIDGQKEQTGHKFSLQPLALVRDKMKQREVASIHGSSFIVSFDIIRKHGFIDPDFFLYGEETDYCYRLRQKGIPSIIVPASIVVHKGRASTNLSLKLSFIKAYYMNRNRFYFSLNHEGKSRKTISNEHKGLSGIIARLIKTKIKALYLYMRKEEMHTESLLFFTYLEYYETLGLFHFMLGIKGKYLKPERFL